MEEVTADLTVAALLQREGVQWPPVSGSRHALHEAGHIEAWWADGLQPRAYVPPVTTHAQSTEEGHHMTTPDDTTPDDEQPVLPDDYEAVRAAAIEAGDAADRRLRIKMMRDM